MYTNINGTSTSGTLSTADLAALKAYVTAQQSTGGLFVGYSDAQIAAALNSPTTIPNPAPQGSNPVTSLPRQTVQLFMTQVIMALIASNSALVSKYQYLQTQVNAFAGGSFTVAEFSPFMTQAVTDEVITQAQATALTTAPDPMWQAAISLSAWALRALSAPAWLVDTDIAAALAAS